MHRISDGCAPHRAEKTAQPGLLVRAEITGQRPAVLRDVAGGIRHLPGPLLDRQVPAVAAWVQQCIIGGLPIQIILAGNQNRLRVPGAAQQFECGVGFFRRKIQAGYFLGLHGRRKLLRQKKNRRVRQHPNIGKIAVQTGQRLPQFSRRTPIHPKKQAGFRPCHLFPQPGAAQTQPPTPLILICLRN